MTSRIFTDKMRISQRDVWKFLKKDFPREGIAMVLTMYRHHTDHLWIKSFYQNSMPTLVVSTININWYTSIAKSKNIIFACHRTHSFIHTLFEIPSYTFCVRTIWMTPNCNQHSRLLLILCFQCTNT